jgi:hypothetical protein
LVKVIRRDARLHKIFQIATFAGDRARCLRAAAKAARAFDKAHPKLTRRERAEIPRAKKDKDLPLGVRRVKHKVAGKTYRFFEASWSPTPGVQMKKRFSVDRYGQKGALKKAIATRKVGLATMK